MFSPLRVAQVATAAGMTNLGAFDLRTGWNLDEGESRRIVEETIDREKPWLVTMSPPCRMLSALQNLTGSPRNPGQWIKDYKKAIGYVEWCMKLAEKQMAGGRLFVFEAPATAKSWQIKALVEFCRVHKLELFIATTAGCGVGLTEPGTGLRFSKRWQFLGRLRRRPR